MTWPPLPDDPDTAAESHTVLDSFPEHKRTAAAMLLELPPTYRISVLCDPLDRDVIVGDLTASMLLVDLWHNVATVDQVVGMLTRQRLIRPGLGGAT
jgi:hypothetical protein